MNKKVLYISYDGMTDPLGQSQVIPYLQGLSKLGYEFTILSFEKKEKLLKDGDEIRAMLKSSGIRWHPKIFTSRPPFLSKLYDAWQIKSSAIKLHRKHNFSFVHCRSYVAAEAGLTLFKNYKLRFLFDMRGFWVDERVDSGQWDLKKPVYRLLYKHYKRKEKNYFIYSDHIISLTSKGQKELIGTYKVPASKITVIPCCVDLAHFDFHKIDKDIIAAKKKEVGIPQDAKVLSYLGSLGGWYLLNEMLDFFIELKKKEPFFKFLFITHDGQKIKSLAQTKGIDADDFIIQPAARQEVPALLAISNWSIFFIKDAYSKKASSPTKQGEIMGMGIPVICNDIGDTGKIIADTQTGAVINHFTVEEYHRVIDDVKQHDPGKENIRQSAFAYFDLDKGIDRYYQVYKSMIE